MAVFLISTFACRDKSKNRRHFRPACANEVSLPKHTPDWLQRQLDAISSVYPRAGLVVNSKKRKSFTSHQIRRRHQPTFFISDDQLGLTEQFTYLGCIATSTCDLTAEVQRRVNLASASFGRLCKRVFKKRNLSTRNKMVICNAKMVICNDICVSTLLYTCKG